jgi:hypothetical protein
MNMKKFPLKLACGASALAFALSGSTSTGRAQDPGPRAPAAASAENSGPTAEFAANPAAPKKKKASHRRKKKKNKTPGTGAPAAQEALPAPVPEAAK